MKTSSALWPVVVRTWSQIFRGGSARRARPTIEALESRIAPATFTGAGTTLTIDLNTANEGIAFTTNGTTIAATLVGGTATDGGGTGGNIAGFDTGTAAITSAAFTAIKVTDSSTGNSVFFSASSGSYPQSFDIALDDPAAGGVGFTGNTTFAFATGFDVTHISATGNILQTAGTLTTTGTGTLTLSSTNGSINLPSNNAIASTTTLGLSTTGANPISIVNNNTLLLGDVRLDTGALTLGVNGGLSQNLLGTIETEGALTVNMIAAAGGRNITLNSAGNRIGGAVTFAETGGDLNNINFRNDHDDAQMPAIAALATASDVNALTLFFANNGITLPAAQPVNINVTTGGDLTQTGTISVTGTARFAVNGDFVITLTDAGNNFGGGVSLSAPQSTRPVQVVEANGLQLDDITLGRGTFSGTAIAGSITQSDFFVQAKGAGVATFTVAAGQDITLNNAGNRFTGSVVFAGADLVNFSNADSQADFSQLTIPGSVTDLTVFFNNASIGLPTLNLTNLSVTANGIAQQPGSTLNITGTAVFSGGSFDVTLANAGNDFTTLSVNNLGRNHIAVTDIDDVTFGNSSFGTGRLLVTAGGAIGQVAATTLTQPASNVFGEIIFASTGGSINLGNNNTLSGPVSATVSGANTITITNPNAILVLGDITTAAGAFTANAALGISQDSNSVLMLGNTSSFTSTGNIDLTNRANTLVGAVSLAAANASLRATGAVILGASNVADNLNIKTGGAATHSITQTGALIGGTDAVLDVGAGNITLTTATNNFGSVSLFSTGTAVSITDANALQVRNSQLGGGTLTITTGGNITTGGPLVQTTGTGLITLNPSGNNIQLNNADNFLRGMIAVTSAGNVNFRSDGDVTFTAGSVVTGNLIATAGATITLPGDLSQLDALTLSANLTTISSDVTVTQAGGTGIDVTGELVLTGNRIITATGSDITFRGGLTAGGSLTLNLPNNGTVQVQNGEWNQGANALTINGTTADLTIGGTGRVVFNMTSGTISMPGGGDISVLANATVRIGATAAAETVTVANGTGTLSFATNSVLEVGLGATNDQLIKTGTGAILLSSSLLRGTSLAGATSSPVLVAETLINGRFADSVDADGTPVDFFAGSDIVFPTYETRQVSLRAGGIAAPTGTISGFLPDGDRYTISSSLGATSGLAIVENLDGTLSVVVRNATAAGASTLNISTNGGGDGFLGIDGVMVHTPGAVSIAAPAGDFIGLLTTNGPLASLVAHNLGTGSSKFVLTSGGPVAGKTSITANEVRNSTLELTGMLDKFKAVSVGVATTITADKFGSITTIGAPLGSSPSVPGVPNPGDFDATLNSTTTTDGVVLASASIKGALTGTWDLRGSAGKVTAGSAENWTLGTEASSVAQNGNLFTDVKSLTIGQVITSLRINATGTIAAFTAGEIDGSGNVVIANSFGTVKVTGNSALGLVGNMASTTFIARGNTGGMALKTLSVAGDLDNVRLTLLNGDAGTLTVGRTVSDFGITATDTGGRGNIKSFTAGEWESSFIDARTLGTLKITGNLKAGLLGDFTIGAVTLRGNTNGTALGTFTTLGNVDSSTFTIQNGNVPTFKVGRELRSTMINLTDPVFGNLGTIQAGNWNSVIVRAKTIGTLASVGAVAAGPASPLLRGNIDSSTIIAYLDAGTAPAIGKATTKGNVDTSVLDAGRGIGTLTVGRTIDSSTIVADDTANGALAVGRIGTLTAGAVDAVQLSAHTLGKVKFTGFAVPDDSSASFVFGDVNNLSLFVHGVTPAKPVGIDSLSIARHFSGSTLAAPFGIKTLTVGGEIANTTIIADHPTTPATGGIGTFTAGELDNTYIRVGSIGTMKVTGNTAALLGNAISVEVAVLSGTTVAGGLQAIGTFSAAGDLSSFVLDAPASVGKIDVVGHIGATGNTTRILAGYAAGSKLGSLTAASWGVESSVITTDLVSQSVGSFTLKGNIPRGIAGTVGSAFIDILGNSGGVGLGTFLATGDVSNSLIRVSDGDVTSFTAQRLTSSDLLVGFRFVKGSDITETPAAANWTATNHKIGSFKTTAPFDLAEVEDSASFVDSNVIAGILGSITISGVNPEAINSTAFGVAFRTAAGAAAAGVVKTNGVAAPLAAPATNGQFNYLGLAG